MKAKLEKNINASVTNYMNGKFSGIFTLNDYSCDTYEWKCSNLEWINKAKFHSFILFYSCTKIFLVKNYMNANFSGMFTLND